MDNKGFGLSQMLAICTVIGLCLIMAAITYSKNFGSNSNEHPKQNTEINSQTMTSTKIDETPYKNMEKELSSTAETYNKTLENKKEIITVSELIKEKKLISFLDPNDKKNSCLGYVIYNEILDTYQAYMRCKGVYATDGYDTVYE